MGCLLVMENNERRLEMNGQAVKVSKHIEIDSSIRRLEQKMLKIEDLLRQLSGGSPPILESQKAAASKNHVSSWNEVYTSLSVRIEEISDKLEKVHANLSEMLL